MAVKTTPMTAAMVAGATTATATLTVAVLLAVAKPDDFARRIAAVEQGLDAAAHRVGSRGARVDVPPGAVCSLPPTEAAARIRAAVSGAASAAALAVERLEVTPRPDERGLSPYDVDFSGNGSYEAAVTAVSGLEAARPMLFIETADLVSRTSAVSLQIRGRVFCAASQ